MAKFVSKRAPATVPTVFSSGCTLLDLAAGGGWGIGRVTNIVGDSSTGKTLLAIEACANFGALYGGKSIRYAEIEAAFDRPYAYTMGMPKDAEYTEDVHTIEDFERDLDAGIAQIKQFALDGGCGIQQQTLGNLDRDTLSGQAQLLQMGNPFLKKMFVIAKLDG